MDIPRFDKSSQKKEKERRGAGVAGAGGVPGASPVSLGGAPAASPVGAAFSTAAPGGAASSWSSLMASAAKTLGISSVAATKGGVVALTLLAGTIAAGISLIVGESSMGGRPKLGHRVFDKNTASQESSGAFSPSTEDPSSGQGSSALDYLRQANTTPAAEASVEDGAVADSPGPAAKDAEVKQWAEAVKSNPQAKSEGAKAQGPKPVLKPGSGKIELKTSSMQSSVQLAAMTDFSGGVGSQFQDIYKPKAYATAKPSYGPNRRIPMTGGQSGSSAWDQAKFAGGMSRKAARMGTGPGSAAAAGLPFDGGMALGQSSRASGYGSSLGGTNDKIGASGEMDIKSFGSEEPPKPNDVKDTKNKTPYQGMIYAAVAALMMGQILVAVAGQLVGQAQKTPGPQSASLLAMAKATAAAAMAAGGTAAGLGGAIAGEYDQITQGLPFMIGGAVIAMQAGMVLIKAEKAGQDASQGVGDAGQAASDTSNGNLQPPQIPNLGGGGNNEPSEQPKQKEHVKPAGRTYIDQPTGGNVSPPGEDTPSTTIGL
ncbi:MAG: hypothetical protein WC728_06595 [Elusimicrobiota bacterium]